METLNGLREVWWGSKIEKGLHKWCTNYVVKDSKLFL